ncbi:MAG: helix-turn-helix domain-containing protein [Rubrivivax sp.]
MDYPLRIPGQLRAHLRALRKQGGLTQAQLGQRLGLSQVRIAEIEADPAVVSVEQLARILSALGATLVLRDKGAQPAPGAEAPASPTRAPGRARAKDEPAPGPAARKPATRASKKVLPSVMPAIAPKKGSW